MHIYICISICCIRYIAYFTIEWPSATATTKLLSGVDIGRVPNHCTHKMSEACGWRALFAIPVYEVVALGVPYLWDPMSESAWDNVLSVTDTLSVASSQIRGEAIRQLVAHLTEANFWCSTMRTAPLLSSIHGMFIARQTFTRLSLAIPIR